MARASGLAHYSCLRACLIWIVLALGAFYFFLHYGIVVAPPAVEDSGGGAGEAGYLVGFLSRFFTQVSYQILCLTFLAVLGYGLSFLGALMTSQAVRSSGRLRGTHRVLSILCGIPSGRVDDEDDWRTFVRYGIEHATIPVRDAATIFPGLGFLGTVVGVSIAVSGLDVVIQTGETKVLLTGLRTAFDTTFIGLFASIVLSLLVLIVQSFGGKAESILAEPSRTGDVDTESPS